MYWRPTPPGFYRGFWMSYKAEVATYELDKLLKLEMVAPTVEREFKGVRGAMVLWVEKVVDLKDPTLRLTRSRASGTASSRE